MQVILRREDIIVAGHIIRPPSGPQSRRHAKRRNGEVRGRARLDVLPVSFALVGKFRGVLVRGKRRESEAAILRQLGCLIGVSTYRLIALLPHGRDHRRMAAHKPRLLARVYGARYLV